MQRTTRPQHLSRFWGKPNTLLVLIIGLLMLSVSFVSSADPVVGPITPANSIIGGNANDRIGSNVIVLPSGNVLIISPNWNGGRGAVTCLTPAEYQAGNIVVTAVNSLTGTATTHSVGNAGVTVLSNGNYVVASTFWDNGGISNAGAATWGDGSTCSTNNTIVSAANSLVGSTTNNNVSGSGVLALNNGHYVVVSQNWDGVATDVGSVTWCNGTTGCTGAVSAANSLVGSTISDHVGDSIIALSNGNYVVASAYWNNGSTVDAGAITWGNGLGGTVGAVSTANSLVGSITSDFVGSPGVVALTNGNYVVTSLIWNNGGTEDVGAVTWCNGGTGCIGAVSAANSLVGSTNSDEVGSTGVTPLNNGNYVVRSYKWDGAATDVGAVTWCSGATGCTGAISASNSLVGSIASDMVGANGVTALTNGNYVVSSSNWDGVAMDIGAVTWCDGAIGCTGAVSASNSLVGSTTNDRVGVSSVTALTNGNYVVSSVTWDGVATDVGAVTWCSGETVCTGVVSASNSLVGSTANDNVGHNDVTALTNGNYVVRSPAWDGAAADVGAVTWGNGLGGTVGMISASNSLVGSTGNDSIGTGVVALTNGNYIVRSYSWDGAAADVGAVTWGNGLGGTVGAVSASNSLVGSTFGDQVGNALRTLSNGDYVVSSQLWDGLAVNVGAVTWGNGLGGTVGAVSASNSLVGSTTNDLVGSSHAVALSDREYLVVSPFWDNGGTADVGAVTYNNGEPSTPPGVTVSQTAVGATEGGVTGDYTVVLNAQPSADVIITVTGDAQASVSPTTLTFTTVTWNIPQTVTVTAVDDLLIEGAHTGTVTHSAAGGGYDAVSVASVTVNISDDDALNELLLNRGFETAGSVAQKAQNWTIKTVSSPPAKRVCNKLDKIVAYEGNCAFKFNYRADATVLAAERLISQSIIAPAVEVGDTLNFSLQTKAKNLQGGARIVVTVFYPTLPKQTLIIAIPSGTYDYTLVSNSLVLTGTPTRIRVNIATRKALGTLFVDDASLLAGNSLHTTLNSSVRDGAVLDIPSAPEGFRK